MSSTVSRKCSWVTQYCLPEDSDTTEEQKTMLNHDFAELELALRRQIDYLDHFKRTIKRPDLEDMLAGGPFKQSHSSEKRANDLEKAHKAWKDGWKHLRQSFERLEASINTNVFHDLYATKARSQHDAQSPKFGSFSSEYDRGGMTDAVNYEYPRQVPKPTGRSGTSRRSSPSTPSSLFEMPPPARPDLAPPVPARNPNRNASIICSPTRSLRLFNAPSDFVANRLPEEHVEIARARKRKSLYGEQKFDPNATLRADTTRKTPKSNHSSANMSWNSSFSKIMHPSRSSSSLRLSAVLEDHPQPLPHIDTGILRQNSRIQRPPQPPAPSTTQASNAFYSPAKRGDPRPPSHLPTAVRTETGLFAGTVSPTTPTPRPSRQPSHSTLAKAQSAQFREKLRAHREHGLLQVNEAERLLRAISPAEPLDHGWQRAPEAVYFREGLQQRAEEGLGNRLKSLWSRTRKTRA